MDIIVGTAGHIDHGKTALVRALTGVDADRLPEEKRRGITIDLGFAELDLGDDVRLGFVDVPGHEKFVKNMLAGAHGIDIVILVIAADEGVMPQTREHFDICRLLAVKSGLIVLTKSDLVDDGLLELAKLEVAELVYNSFLADAPVIAVSTKNSAGINDLKNVLKDLALKIPTRVDQLVTRLPIDRAFSVKGFGAVVTGTLVAGEITVGAEMELLPAAKKVRVRNLQTYGKTIERAHAGQRAAINLGGLDHSEIERGMILAPSNTFRPTQIFDAHLEVLKTAAHALKSRQRVRVHIGTIEVLGRVQILAETGAIAPGETGLAQFRLESPVVVVPSERFIVRFYSPPQTMAGGKILDNAAVKHPRKNLAATRERLGKWLLAEQTNDKPTQLQLILETAGVNGMTRKDLQARTGWQSETLQTALTQVLTQKLVLETEKVFLTRPAFENLLAKTLLAVESHHRREPLTKGIGRETLREKIFAHLPPEIFRACLIELEKLRQITLEKDIVRHASHSYNLAPSEKELLAKLKKIYRDAGLEVPSLENALNQAIANTKITKDYARKIFQLLVENGEIVLVTPEFYFRKEYLTQLINKMREFADNSPDRAMDMIKFKDLSHVSRKYAIPLLEYFDREKVTQRAGDKRLVL